MCGVVQVTTKREKIDCRANKEEITPTYRAQLLLLVGLCVIANPIGAGFNNKTMDKVIKMNFPPDMVEKYCKKWLAQAKKEKAEAANLKMMEDIVTMVGLAKKVMTPANGGVSETKN